MKNLLRLCVPFPSPLLFSILLLISLARKIQSEIPVEQDILLELKQAWNSPNPIFETWVRNNDCSKNDEWVYVTCDSTGNVLRLDLADTQLSGSLPSSIGDMRYLQYLNLKANKLEGNIPDSIGNLYNLKFLSLANNSFVGSIPYSLGNLKKLQNLYLWNNRLSGTLPSSIGSLVDLENIDLSTNQLSGSIPSFIGNLKKLQYIGLTENRFEGAIPSEIGELGGLTELYLYTNQLSGNIPRSLGRMTSLQVLYLWNNQLSGSIPSSIGSLVNLEKLDLSSNQLSGPIPDSIGNLKKLQYLSLFDNELSGSIPFSISKLANLQKLYLSSNQLSGPIPSLINNLKNIIGLDLSSNYFTGISSINCDIYNECDLKSNCLKNVDNQRSTSECSSFCAANLDPGPCNGHGTCALNAANIAKCTCNAGWTSSNCQNPVKRPPPPPSTPSGQPPRSPPTPNKDWPYTFLIPTPRAKNTPHLNQFFRYASYRYTGTSNQPNWDLTASVDWRGDTAPVEDQGLCNACWAMAPAATVESVFSISNSGLKILSKQQILDCQGLNNSCGGGWPTDAFEYIASHGVAKSSDYPWSSGNQECEDDGDLKYKNVKISMYEEVDYYGSFGLILAVQNQPVVVNIQSSSAVFQNYQSGIMDSNDCFTNVVDHTVVVVGYNLFQDTKPYWILRNSWGTEWGEEGYMRLAYTGGLGICGIHSTPAYYPVLPFSVSSFYSNTKNPCGVPNPCGSGKCTIDPATKLNNCSQCPAGFVVAKNLDGTQSCVAQRVCLQKAFNPCGVGSCVEDMKGGYSCICPVGYTQTTYSDTKAYTCVEASTSKQPLYYSVQNGDSCSVIALSYGLSLSQLKKQNPTVNCQRLVAGKTRLNVTQSPKWAGCAVKYSWSKGDSCSSILSLLGISQSALLSLNPDLDCNGVRTGTQICVKSGPPPVKTPLCNTYVSVSSTDTCASIIKKFKLNVYSFLLYNPGINCNTLLPSTFKLIKGPMVCVDISDPYGRARAKCSSRSYSIQKYDTCTSIIRKYFKNSVANFKKKNNGFSCFSKRFKVNQVICW